MLRTFLRAVPVSSCRTLGLVPRHALSAHTSRRSVSLILGPPKHQETIRCPRRTMSTYKQSEVTMEEYHQLSDTTMEALLDSLEVLVDQHPDLPFEVEYHSGVLTLALGDKGTYVINKQPPNKQIWLSSPRSGPKRYDLDVEQNEWFYGRDNTTLRSLLEEELGSIFGQAIQINLGES